MDPPRKAEEQILAKIDALHEFVRSSTKFDTLTLAITIISFVFLIVGSSYTIYQVVRLHKLFKNAIDDATADDGGANTTV